MSKLLLFISFFLYLSLEILGLLLTPSLLYAAAENSASCSDAYKDWVASSKYELTSPAGKNIEVSVTFSKIADSRKNYFIHITDNPDDSIFQNGKITAFTDRVHTKNSQEESPSERSLTQKFIVEAPTEVGRYYVYLRIIDSPVEYLRSKICLLSSPIDVYDPELAKVACNVTFPNNVVAGEGKEFKIQTNIKPINSNISYSLYVFKKSGVTLPKGRFRDLPEILTQDAGNYYVKDLTQGEESLVYRQSGTTINSTTRLSPGSKTVAILATHRTSVQDVRQWNKYFCTIDSFSASPNDYSDLDKTNKTSESLSAVGAEKAGLLPGEEDCRIDGDGPFFQTDLIRAKTDNLRDSNSFITAILKDASGKALKADGPKRSNETGAVQFSFDPSGADLILPDGTIESAPKLETNQEYSVEIYSSKPEQVCKNKILKFRLQKKELPPPEYDESGKILAKCSVKSGLQTDSPVDFSAVGLENGKKYQSYLSKVAADGSTPFLSTGESKVSEDGTANFSLGKNLPIGDYVASLNDANNENVCTSKTFSIGKTARKEAADEAADQSCITRRALDSKIKCIDKSAGEPCRAFAKDSEPPDGILTAIGCFPTNPAGLMQAGVKIGVSAGGGIALLMMVFAAFRMITSAGNPETIKKGQEQFASAIIGLLFIIFSVLLLEIIGVDILNLPGFGR